MYHEDKFSVVSRITSFIAPVIVFLIFLGIYVEDYEYLLKFAFGNGSILTPMAILAIIIVAKKWNRWKLFGLLAFIGLSIAAFCIQGHIFNQALQHSDPKALHGIDNVTCILGMLAIYVMLIMLDIYDHNSMNLNTES